MSLFRSLKKTFPRRFRSSRRDKAIDNDNEADVAALGPTKAPSRDVNAQQSSMLESSLWDQAYEDFRTKDSSKNAKLVDEYEALLKKHLNIDHLDTGNDSESTGSVLSLSQRRAQLHFMLEQGKGEHEVKGKILIGKHAINVRDYLASLAGIVDFVKDWVTDAAKVSPEASVAWSIVCLGLPLLTKPAQVEANNLDGLVYVTSRMQFYIALEGLLLPPQVTTTNAYTRAQDALRARLLELYQLILDFQIRTIVRFYKGHWYEDIYGKNDWKSMHNTIKELETGIQQDSAMITSNDFRIQLQKMHESAESAQAALLCVQEKQLEAMWDFGVDAKEQVNILHQILQQANNGSAIQGDQQRQQQEAKCLQLFRLETSYEAMKAGIPYHVERTCQWFLKQPAYTDWLSQPSKCLLVSADPGCGKSVLARNLIDNELTKHNPDMQIYYFFFKQRIQDSLSVAIPALLHQLMYSHNQCFRHVLPLYEKEGRYLVKNIEAMLRLLREILVELGSISSIVIVLDALDECESSDRGKLLTWIRESLDVLGSTEYGTKFLLTCRPYDEIVSFYEYNASTSHVHIPGNAESDAISQEVNLVIKYRVEQLYRRKRIKKVVQDELEQKLLAQANRTYLWIAVVFDELERKIGNQTQKDVQRMLQSLPNTLHEAYEEILNRYTEDVEICEKVSLILNVMLAAARPLDVQEIQCAVKIQLSPRSEAHTDLDLEDVDDFSVKLRNWCGLFVRIHDNRATFLHQTARDFLLMKSSQMQTGIATIQRWGGFTSLTQAHSMMTRICLAYLLLKDFEKLFEGWGTMLIHPDSYNDNNHAFSLFNLRRGMRASGNLLSQYHLFTYAAGFWDQHFEYGSCVADDDLLGDALSLLDPNTESFCNWIRILRFCENPSEARLLWTFTTMKSPSLFRIIIQKHNFSLQVPTDKLALRTAIEEKKRDNVFVLVKYGINDRSGYNSIFQFILQDVIRLGWTEILEGLLEAGVNPDLTIDRGRTALYLSCSHNQPNMVRSLLRYGANINAQDRHGSTALMLAAERGYTELVRLLLEHDADPTIEDADCDTAWTCATSFGHEGIGKLLPVRILPRRLSMSDLWPCKPFWDREMNGRNSTYNRRERRPFQFPYKPPRRPSLIDLASVALDDEFLDILKQRKHD